MEEDYCCADCGCEDAEEVACPYTEEVYGEIEIVYLCGACYRQRHDDI